MNPEDLAGVPPARLPFPVTRAEARPITTRASEGMPTMVGRFSTFGDWYEVDSLIEGHFLESVGTRAFEKTISESRASMKVLYDHGHDPQIGNKILGPIEELGTDAGYVVPLFDTSYNRDLAPGLIAGVYGSSFRFTVEKDVWDYTPARSAHNPDGLPERTITEARVYEFGPVTFPANPAATAGIRSTTDNFYQRSRDPEAFESLLRSAQVARTPAPAGAAARSDEPPASTPSEPLEPDTPRPPDPPPAMPAPTEDPLRSGSLDSQENRTVDYITRDEKTARIDELKAEQSRTGVEYPGVMPPDVQARWDAAVKEQDDLERDVAAWDARQARIAANAANAQLRETAPYSPPVVNQINRKGQSDIYDIGGLRSGSRSDEEYRSGLRDNAMRSVETSRFPNPNITQDAAREQAAHLLDFKDSPDKEMATRFLQTGNPAYRSAFEALVAGRHLSPEQERAAALAVVGTTTTGGYAVPYIFDPTIIHTGAYTNINPFRQICRVETIVGGNVWRGVSAGAIAAQYRAEGDAMTEGGPTFALPTYTAQRADAFVTLSREALQDRPDFVSELSSIIDEGKATNEETQFSIGVGTTVFPSGMFVKGKFTVKETITDNTFAVADLDATEAALPLRFRRDAVWMLARGVIRIVQGFETAYGKYFNSTLGYPAVGDPANNPGGNTGLSLLGYPVWETPSAPVTVTGDDTVVGILVAPKNYIIVDRAGMEVEIIPNMFDATTGFPTGQRGLAAIWRNTAGPLNADAGRQININ
jgi:HK97 family phage major capsid protein